MYPGVFSVCVALLSLFVSKDNNPGAVEVNFSIRVDINGI